MFYHIYAHFKKLYAINTFDRFCEIHNPSIVFILVIFFLNSRYIFLSPELQIQKAAFSSLEHLFMVLNTLSNEETD